MKIVCIFFVLICLCGGCKDIGSQKITINKDNFLPETGAQQIRPPKEISASEPMKLEQPNAPKALIPEKLDEPKALSPKKK